jgi:hypothetical protein
LELTGLTVSIAKNRRWSDGMGSSIDESRSRP